MDLAKSRKDLATCSDGRCRVAGCLAQNRANPRLCGVTSVFSRWIE
jgi:hypothetical protein